jgi:hypothetical protein
MALGTKRLKRSREHEAGGGICQQIFLFQSAPRSNLAVYPGETSRSRPNIQHEQKKILQVPNHSLTNEAAQKRIPDRLFVLGDGNPFARKIPATNGQLHPPFCHGRGILDLNFAGLARQERNVVVAQIHGKDARAVVGVQ